MNDILMELRLLLSPDNEQLSPLLFNDISLIHVTGAAILVGLDNLFSRSTSERNGRFGVNFD